MPARSAEMLIVLATSRATIKTPSSHLGNRRLKFPANPCPVTIPIRAHIIWTAAISGHVRSAVQRSLVPSCAPATEYVAMPDGSSSAAPVLTPGPSDFHSNRIHRAGANVGTNESDCVPFLLIKARIRSQSYMARSKLSAPKRPMRLFDWPRTDDEDIHESPGCL